MYHNRVKTFSEVAFELLTHKQQTPRKSREDAEVTNRWQHSVRCRANEASRIELIVWSVFLLVSKLREV